jgi:hypothetical protein
MMLRRFIWLRIGPLVSRLFNLMLPQHTENSQQFVGHIHPSLFACSNFAVSQICAVLRGEKANHRDRSVERNVRVVRQRLGIQGVAGKQKDSHRHLCAKKRHSRNNKTFLAGLNFSFLPRWRGEVWKLNPEKVRDNNTGFSVRAGLDWAVLCCAGPGRAVLCCAVLGWAGLCWDGMGCAVRN